MRRCFVLLGLMATAVFADVYMHNPRGSNDRNCERNVNRNNGNRLFDSQNNAKGGYACPRAVGGGDDKAQLTDRMYYYEGSTLAIEWTAQHGCGLNSKVNCEIVLQYACEDTLDPNSGTVQGFRAQNGNAGPCADADIPGQAPYWNANAAQADAPLTRRQASVADPSSGCIVGAPRDGTPTNQADAATDRIPFGNGQRGNAIPTTADTRRYGMHENYDFYQDCNTRGRNRGLFTADQNVNGNQATRTRQNPNGNRNGLECPEERDYYPYWHPSPWRDIAVLTNQGSKLDSVDAQGNPTTRTARCKYYQEESQNVKPKGECLVTDDAGNVITGPQAAAYKATVNRQNNRWFNNNEQPPNGAAGCPSNNNNNGNNKYYDSCWCAANANNVKVKWVESRFAYGANYTGFDFAPPDCHVASLSRVNQLGNSAVEDEALPAEARSDGAIPQGTNANRYLWKIPDEVRRAMNPSAGAGAPATAKALNCVLRLRYNISTSDYVAWNANGTVSGAALNARANDNRRRRRNQNTPAKSPITQDPYVTVVDAASTAGVEQDEFVSLALNTNQYGRTFQDRSYVFEIRQRPTTDAIAASQSGFAQTTTGIAAWKARVAANDPDVVQKLENNVRVVNLNVRGKRGNIVQTYPSVEYDFVPNELNLAQNDFVHFQWTGSDYNPRRGCNNGEGGPPDPPNDVNAANQNSRADRSNIVDMTASAMNYPHDDITSATAMQGTAAQAKTLFSLDDSGTPDMKMARKFAYLRQSEYLDSLGADPNTLEKQTCLTEAELNAINNKNQRENHPRNCAKLNAANTPYFDGGAVRMKGKGSFAFFSSRNNNFSNRDQTGRICVGTDSKDAAAKCKADDNPLLIEAERAALAERTEKIISGQIGQIVAGPAVTPILDAPPPDGFQERDNDSTGDGQAEGCEGFDAGSSATRPWVIASIVVGAGALLAFVGVRARNHFAARGGAAGGLTPSGLGPRKKDPSSDKTWLSESAAGKDTI